MSCYMMLVEELILTRLSELFGKQHRSLEFEEKNICIRNDNIDVASNILTNVIYSIKRRTASASSHVIMYKDALSMLKADCVAAQSYTRSSGVFKRENLKQTNMPFYIAFNRSGTFIRSKAGVACILEQSTRKAATRTSSLTLEEK